MGLEVAGENPMVYSGRGEYSDSANQKPANTNPTVITFNTTDLESKTITHLEDCVMWANASIARNE